jgi:hypothetical protein
MSLKSIISLLLSQIPWILFSSFKSSDQVQRCMNWKGIEFQASNKYQEFCFSRWYDPMWIMSISFLFISDPQGVSVKIGVSDFGHRICPASSPDSSKVFWACPVILPDMSNFSAKISIWIKNFIFDLSLSSILIYVIMWRFHGAWIWSGLLIRKIYHGLSLYVWSWAKLYFINS